MDGKVLKELKKVGFLSAEECTEEEFLKTSDYLRAYGDATKNDTHFGRYSIDDLNKDEIDMYLKAKQVNQLQTIKNILIFFACILSLLIGVYIYIKFN